MFAHVPADLNAVLFVPIPAESGKTILFELAEEALDSFELVLLLTVVPLVEVDVGPVPPVQESVVLLLTSLTVFEAPDLGEACCAGEEKDVAD